LGAASGFSQSNHLAAIYETLFPSPPSETIGTAGKTWDQVELDQIKGNLTLMMNGVVIAQSTNASGYNSGNIMVGLMDTYPSIANPDSQCYVLFDNVRVEDLTAAPTIAPAITNLQSGAFCVGATAALSVSAGGTAPFFYQWYTGGMPLSGQTNSTLVLTNIQPASGGAYDVQVSNGAGSAWSTSPANLTVLFPVLSLGNPPLVGRAMALTLTNVFAGETAVMQSSDDLLNWTAVQTNPVTASWISITNYIQPPQQAGYYRVLVFP
jgi:hypothetical protein